MLFFDKIGLQPNWYSEKKFIPLEVGQPYLLFYLFILGIDNSNIKSIRNLEGESMEREN